MKTTRWFRTSWFVWMTMFLLGASSFVFLSYAAFHWVESQGLRMAVLSVCSRIETDYVKNREAKSRAFTRECYDTIDDIVSLSLSGRYGRDARRALIAILNEKLSALRISHLGVFAPDETTAMWTGEAVDTGVRARLVDGEIVVTRVLANSSAARTGVHVGDLVLAINGEPVADPSEVTYAGGLWETVRPDDTRISLAVEAQPLQEDITPKWIGSNSKGVYVLKIPSFLAQAIESEEWSRIQTDIAELKVEAKLVIDLRGNAGGSFPAMLRVLGQVRCDTRTVGWIYRGRVPENPKDLERASTLANDIAAEPQLKLLEANETIALVPFSNGNCFSGKVGVLIDQGTGSVAEIFAQAMKERPNTLVAGWRSAGRVVMARWFQIAGLSPDYTVSVPVALYRSAKGHELEGQGVSPDQILTDSLKRWRSARDPWLQDIASAVSL